MKGVFLRLLEGDDKGALIRKAIELPTDERRFEVEPADFGWIPSSPFAYWVRRRVRRLFQTLAPFEGGDVPRSLSIGASTKNDFRYVRALWEVPASAISWSREDTYHRAWVLLAKGGRFSPYGGDVHLAVLWRNDGRELKADISEYRGRRGWGYQWSAALNGHSHYFRPGLTWPRRTQAGLSLRALPAGCIFADKGPAAFVGGDDRQELLALLAVANSRPFGALVELQMAFGSYEVGVLQRTPVPDLAPSSRNCLASLAHRAWSLKRMLDTRAETSHALHLPALLQVECTSLSERAASWLGRVSDTEAEIRQIQRDIDDLCFHLYGFDDEDRRRIEEGFGAAPSSRANEDVEEVDEEEGGEESGEVEAAPLVASLVSWAAGAAVGRFDIRLATGGREPPPEPDPFDPLPVCSPGMLTGEEGLPATAAPPRYPLDLPAAGILVDDPGHADDLAARIRRVFEVTFSSDADSVFDEAADILNAPGHDLRAWLARSFFPEHVKRYSKSRRKAPIYWQLSTPSASYSVWLYIHRFTRDTLHRVLHDYVTPKLQHEQRKLDALRSEAGDNPTAAQRREIAVQETFVEELQTFHEEVVRVAPLWNPNLDDGVIVNFAPLWRLVPQHRAWQRECRSCWDKLAAGDYDWAHLAMHLWPERVVPKCAEDRSLAIAHGLEEVFWREDEQGKWHRRRVGEDEMRTLVEERTSPAVKAALQDLQSVSGSAGGAGAGRRDRRRRRSASDRPESGAT